MGKRSAWLLLVLAMCYALVASGGAKDDDGIDHHRGDSNENFLLRHSRHVVNTEAGDMWLLRPHGHRVQENPMHIGILKMRPQSLLVPMYLDAHLVLFIRQGEAKIGHICQNDLVERQLRTGDVYPIEAGSAFYMVNHDQNQKLQVICSIKTSQNLGWRGLESFYIGGGRDPTSVLAGFDTQTMSRAMNVSTSDVKEITRRQRSGPIVHLSNSNSPSQWAKFMELEHKERQTHLKGIVKIEEEINEEVDKPTWSLKRFLVSVLGTENRRKIHHESSSPPESCNLYETSPGFKNNYGCVTSLDESTYSPLRDPDISVHHANLREGSMLAPRINPTATEYGIVLKGSGSLQIVYPNGSLAVNTKIREGDVYRVPRYFPSCQIASSNGPLELLGFSTSSRRNCPHFLVGRNSILNNLRGPEIATAYGVSQEKYEKIATSQRESIILPWHNENMEIS